MTDREPLEELSDHDKEILKFEAKGWRMRGVKESAMRDAFHLTPTRYYQTLNRIIDLPAAMQFDPTLVARLHRQRADGVAKKYVRE
jgi:hypothetical protein